MKQIVKVTSTFLLLTVVLFSCSGKKLHQEKALKASYTFLAKIEQNPVIPERAIDLASIGYPVKAIQAFDSGCPPPPIGDLAFTEFKKAFTPINAGDVIIEKAKDSKIVMINRLDHLTMNHVFVSNLLEELSLNGYLNFGVEGISESINKRNFRSIEVQLKLQDPHFANLIRTAVGLGYEVFPLDHLFMLKELNGLENTVKEIDRRVKSAKTLLYCSKINSNEKRLKGIGSTLATLIKSRLDIEPLTIDQTEYNEHSSPYYERKLYTKMSVIEPTIFVDKSFNSYKNPRSEWNDLYVFHPRTKFVNNRPHWLPSKQQIPVQLSLSSINIAYPILISAFKKEGSGLDDIPWDIIEIREPVEDVTLYLPKGKYDILFQNDMKETRFKKIKI